MKVHELIERLESLDQDLEINVFRADGDYGTPMPIKVNKRGRADRIVLGAEEDD